MQTALMSVASLAIDPATAPLLTRFRFVASELRMTIITGVVIAFVVTSPPSLVQNGVQEMV